MTLQSRHEKVASDLRRRIHEGEWGPTDHLPSEREISESYGVSRNTSRLALRTLVGEGLLGSVAGRGYYVREWAPLIYYATRSERRERRQAAAHDIWQTDAREQGRQPGQQLSVWRDEAPARIASALGLGEGDRGTDVIVRHRVRLIDGAPYSISTAYWPVWLFGETPIAEPVDLQPGPNRVAADMGYAQVLFTDYIRVRMPDPGEAATLQLDPGIPVAEHTRVGCDGNDLPIRATVTLLPGDKWITVYEVYADD